MPKKSKKKSGIGIMLVIAFLLIPISNASIIGAATTTTFSFSYHSDDIIMYSIMMNDTAIKGHYNNGSMGGSVGYIEGIPTSAVDSFVLRENLTGVNPNVVEGVNFGGINFTYGQYVNNSYVDPTSDLATLSTNMASWTYTMTGTNIFNGSLQNTIAFNGGGQSDYFAVGFNAIPNDTYIDDWFGQAFFTSLIQQLSTSAYESLMGDFGDGQGSNNAYLSPITTGVVSYIDVPISILTHERVEASPIYGMNGTATSYAVYGEEVNYTTNSTLDITAIISASRIINLFKITIISNETISNSTFGMLYQKYDHMEVTISVLYDSTGGASNPLTTTTSSSTTSSSTTSSSTTSSSTTPTASMPLWELDMIIIAGALALMIAVMIVYPYLSKTKQAECATGSNAYYCKGKRGPLSPPPSSPPSPPPTE